MIWTAMNAASLVSANTQITFISWFPALSRGENYTSCKMGRVQLGKWVTLTGSPFFAVEKQVSLKTDSPVIFI